VDLLWGSPKEVTITATGAARNANGPSRVRSWENEDQMNKNLVWLVLSALLLMEVACASKTEQVETGKKSSAATDADDTARNTRDRERATLTPADQAENETDRQITASVRQAVVGDSSLSTNAHNVKIITSAGTVTLRGPVKSTEEKAAIEAKAKQVAGVTRVDNLLEIEANK
jgi:hyperosmotically inducible periplasmic protein